MAWRPLVRTSRRSTEPATRGRHPGSLQADDLGAQVGEHHGAERTGTEPGEFDDTESGEAGPFVASVDSETPAADPDSRIGQVAVDHPVHVQDVALLTAVEAQARPPADFMPICTCSMLA